MLAACLLAAVLAAAQSTGQLLGVVNDATGLALPDATVTLRGPVDRQAIVGGDGRFAIKDLPEGEYELTAGLSGFTPFVQRVRVVAGAVSNVTVTLSVAVSDYTLVTAARTGARNVQTTPMAVSVLSGEELQHLRAHTIEDISGRAPSFTFSQNAGFGQVSIRGVGTNLLFAGSDPSTAVYLDGVYLARPAMTLIDLFDLDRIEVLRGPQGTLYGRNAVGGALSLVTREPTDDLEASARVIAGSLHLLRVDTQVSGPIVRGKVMGSAAFSRGVRRGFVRDLDNPNHPLGGEDITVVRAKLRVIFNERSDLMVSGDISHEDPIPLTYAKVLAVKPGFQVDNPSDLHEVRTSTLAKSRNLQDGVAARLTVRLAPSIALTSLSAFRQLDYDVRADTDISELNLAATNIHEMQHQLSQEVTIAQQRSTLAWIGGLFLFDETDRQPTSVRLEGARVENHLDARVDSASGALFGQATISLTSRASATAGLRYTHERKATDNAGVLLTLDPPVIPLPGAYAYTDAISNAAWTPKAGFELRIGTDTLTYLSATRGFKSGGFNISSPEAGRGYAPEWAWSYEGGLKTTVAGGRARVRSSVFHVDYTDLQVQTVIRPGVLDISNAAAATINGAELEGSADLSRVFQTGGHLAWLDATYDRYIAVGVGGIPGSVAGNRLSNAPELSGRWWLTWRSGRGRTIDVSLRADARWQSTVFFTPLNDGIQRQAPYGLLDVSAELASKRGRYAIEVYARNLTNQDYITGTFSSPPPAIGGRPADSRQLGVRFSVRTVEHRRNPHGG